MFNLFKKKRKVRELNLYLNMPLQPMHRHHLEDELQKMLKKFDLGTVQGGGTMLNDEEGVIQSCDIEIDLYDNQDNSLEKLVDIINKIGVSKASELSGKGITDPIPVGTLEGLAYYNNATELSEDVYKNNDINDVIEGMLSALKGAGALYSFWETDKWTILYFYGDSFEEMKRRIEPFIASHPLCQKSKIERLQ